MTENLPVTRDFMIQKSFAMNKNVQEMCELRETKAHGAIFMESIFLSVFCLFPHSSMATLVPS